MASIRVISNLRLIIAFLIVVLIVLLLTSINAQKFHWRHFKKFRAHNWQSIKMFVWMLIRVPTSLKRIAVVIIQ
jgi:hypothetical protein